MTSDEIAEHLILLETFAMTALGLCLATESAYLGFKRAHMLLEHPKSTISGLGADVSPGVKKAAKHYGGCHVDLVSKNLKVIAEQKTLL